MINEGELREDLEELQKLGKLATRSNVKDLLAKEAQRLQTRLSQQQPASGDAPVDADVAETGASAGAGAAAAVKNPCLSVTKSTPPTYYKSITTYAWDQSEKFMKIYVTVNGVHTLSKELVKAEFTPKSFQLKVDNLGGQNYTCHVAGLWGKIVPTESYHKVKTDMVLLMLKKEEEKTTWAFVTEREDKKKSTPKFDEKKDPNEGLMDMLKKMYDEGDDEMKRTIAKSWTESRNKQSPGLDS